MTNESISCNNIEIVLTQWANTCSAESNEGLGVFPEDLLCRCVDCQLGQEVLNEVMRCDRCQIPFQLAENQQLHLLWKDQRISTASFIVDKRLFFLCVMF